MPKHAWSLPNTNISLDKKWTNIQPIAIILAVSRENGLDHIQTQYPLDDILLVMDNLSLYKSKAMKERMDELGFMYTYTPTYSPWFNGVEEVISIGKNMVKKKRLDMILKGENQCLNKVVHDSF